MLSLEAYIVSAWYMTAISLERVLACKVRSVLCASDGHATYNIEQECARSHVLLKGGAPMEVCNYEQGSTYV